MAWRETRVYLTGRAVWQELEVYLVPQYKRGSSQWRTWTPGMTSGAVTQLEELSHDGNVQHIPHKAVPPPVNPHLNKWDLSSHTCHKQGARIIFTTTFCIWSPSSNDTLCLPKQSSYDHRYLLWLIWDPSMSPLDCFNNFLTVPVTFRLSPSQIILHNTVHRVFLKHKYNHGTYKQTPLIKPFNIPSTGTNAK